ncbi:C40 family peptidase [Micropruina sp.]|uniref:C40 family peptidase n=1 Tax=Micropruina sp. TaxID=2737536 RepID=UPI0039E28CDC
MKVVKAAKAKVKHGQYVRGRSGPNSFDCSGLALYAYRKIGVKLPHSSRTLSTRGKKISKKNLKVGDLVFFYTPVHHVAIYIGGGKIVHARNPKDDLEITKLSKYPHYRWARRIIKW